MPTFDLSCACGWDSPDAVYVPSWRSPNPPCPSCGAVPVRVQRACPNIIPDTFPGGSFSTDNMSGRMERFTSKAEHRRRCKELGLVVKDQHVGFDHTDKSPFSKRWI